MSDNALLIFIKNPEKGKVKTRIAQTAGHDRAVSIYKALLTHTRQVAVATKASRYLFYGDWVNENDNWSRAHFQKELQTTGDLGERMEEAFRFAFAKHKRVVIIGSDCASLTAEIVAKAFNALAHADFVVGPTFDGGYYLLGMRQFEPTVFREMTWSVDSVFAETMLRIGKLPASVFLLPKLSDIDYEEDWEKYGWPITGN